MKVFKLTNKHSSMSYYGPTTDFIEAELELSEIGDVWQIEVVEMTEEEYENIPEFDGFN